jgi:hypothetical protein
MVLFLSGPPADLQATNVSFDAVTTVQTLRITGNTSAVINSWLVNNNTSTITVSCAFALPGGASVLAFLIPLDVLTLGTLLQSRSLVGALSWNGFVTTSFIDANGVTRLVLHPDAIGQSLPLRLLTNCVASPASATTISCSLPANMTGSFWKIYIGWTAPIMWGAKTLNVLPAQLSGPTLIPATSSPLILSWPLPSLTQASGRRFIPNFNGVRTPPLGWTPQGDLSLFDKSFTAPSFSANLSGVWAFPFIPQTVISETLYFTGSFGSAPSTALLQIYMRCAHVC